MVEMLLFLASAVGVGLCRGAATPISPSVFRDVPVPAADPSPSGSYGIAKSSWTLSRDYVEKVLLDAPEELEWFGGGVALLTPDVYEGKRMLVYKLAPGAIFGGERRESEDTKYPISTVAPEDAKPSAGPWVVTPAHHSDEKPLSGHAIKWAIRYLHEPPPLAAMENPYLPSEGSELGSLLRQRLPGRAKTGARGASGSLVERLAEETVRLARSKVRGAWISFLLLHYLGFLPSLPGLPRHKDPDQVIASVVNSPSRVMHLLNKG